jgi:hypothetical protein
MITAFYKLVSLSDELRLKNNIKSDNRLDCVQFSGEYEGLNSFINKKGMMYFFKIPTKHFVKASDERRADISLNNGKLNLSSLYNYPKSTNYGFGYPNAKRLLSNKGDNPLFDFRNDAYLFINNFYFSEIELLVIKNGRNLIEGYYKQLIDGEYDEVINQFRLTAKPFFNY